MNHLIWEKLRSVNVYMLDQLYRYTGSLITPEVIDWIWINKKRKKKKLNSWIRRSCLFSRNIRLLLDMLQQRYWACCISSLKNMQNFIQRTERYYWIILEQNSTNFWRSLVNNNNARQKKGGYYFDIGYKPLIDLKWREELI